MKRTLLALAAVILALSVFTETASSQVLPDKPNTQDEAELNKNPDSEVGEGDIPSSVQELYDNGSIAKLYPNPTSDFVQINFVLNESTNVKAMIYDVSGKFVSTIYNESLSKGHIDFSARLPKLQSGTYLLVINAGKQFLRERIAVL
jgi:Secretion system C-terminal sorting domain